MSFDVNDFKSKVEKSMSHLSSEISKLRTGKATVQLLDPVRVEAYGTMLSLQELSNVTVADPTLLLVKPYDKSQIEAIVKGIQNAQLNLNPVVDQSVIKIAVPPLTQERRQEMVKILQQRLEEGRVMLRNIRSEIKREIEDQKGSEGISEDDIDNDIKQLEQEFKAAVDRLEKLGQDKQEDLLNID